MHLCPRTQTTDDVHMRHARATRLAFLGIASAMMFSGTPVRAQPAAVVESRGGLTPVDPGVADRGGLGMSLRQLQPDLRVPTNFDRVYRVPGSVSGVPAFPGAEPNDRFARISGGLTAVFERSQYLRRTDRPGLIPIVPAGTVFYIGNPPWSSGPGGGQLTGGVPTAASAGSQALVRAGSPIDQGAVDRPVPTSFRVDTRDQGAATPSVPPAGRGPVSVSRPSANVLTSEPYRRQRVRELLQAAADGGE